MRFLVLKTNKFKIALFLVCLSLIIFFSFNLGRIYGVSQPLFGETFYINRNADIDGFQDRAMKKFPHIKTVAYIDVNKEWPDLKVEVTYLGDVDRYEILKLIEDAEDSAK